MINVFFYRSMVFKSHSGNVCTIKYVKKGFHVTFGSYDSLLDFLMLHPKLLLRYKIALKVYPSTRVFPS